RRRRLYKERIDENKRSVSLQIEQHPLQRITRSVERHLSAQAPQAVANHIRRRLRLDRVDDAPGSLERSQSYFVKLAGGAGLCRRGNPLPPLGRGRSGPIARELRQGLVSEDIESLGFDIEFVL